MHQIRIWFPLTLTDHDVLTMSALAFSASEHEKCQCGMYNWTNKHWNGHECSLLDSIYFETKRISHLDSTWFLTYLVTEFMRSSAINMYWNGPNLQDAYAPVIQEMVSVIDSQIGS